MVTSETYLDAADANFGGFGVTVPRGPIEVFDDMLDLIKDPEAVDRDGTALRQLIQEHHEADVWNAHLMTLYRTHVTK